MDVIASVKIHGKYIVIETVKLQLRKIERNRIMQQKFLQRLATIKINKIKYKA